MQKGTGIMPNTPFVEGAAPKASPSVRLAHLMDGFLTTQALYVAAERGIADSLADGPRTAADLAADVGTDAGSLHRVLRLLAAEGILAEGDGGFGLTPLDAVGGLLCAVRAA
jgi:hypothetical protein